MTQSTKPNKGLILMCFPGMGKTYAAKRIPGLVDLDWGYWKQSARFMQGTVAQLMVSYQHMAKIYCKEGFIVLCNDPNLIPVLKQLDVKMVMILPKNFSLDMGKRIMDRELEHPVSMEWANEYVKHWKDWCINWYEAADQYHVPCIRCNYIYDQWDDILKEMEVRYGITWS